MREDLAQYDELQPALVQLVEEARSDLDDETRATAVLIAVRGQLVALDQIGSDGFIVQGDVCQPEDISRMFSRAKQEFGTLDIFVANARPEVPTFYQPPMEITLESWQTAVDSQAKAFLVGAREASALFRDGGRIIAITYAPGGRFGSWQPWVAMGAAKSAMECLCRYFAVALARRKL